jgi:hypothetical protein
LISGKRYGFGSCNFEVNNDGIVKNIYWSEENIVPSKKEQWTLFEVYKRSGLNKHGNKFINKEDNNLVIQ